MGSSLALALACDVEANEDSASARNWRDSLGIRVVRSFKLKRWYPDFAPEVGYRYDVPIKSLDTGLAEGLLVIWFTASIFDVTMMPQFLGLLKVRPVLKTWA